MQEQLPSIHFPEQPANDKFGPATESESGIESISQPQSQKMTSTDENLERAKTVSIIILNYNGRDDTKTCLLSLGELDFPAPQLEIIVVDNGSSDGSADMLRREFPHVRLIENKSNLGFSQGVNQASADATGEYLVFLNNDMRVAKGWLEAMLQVVR